MQVPKSLQDRSRRIYAKYLKNFEDLWDLDPKAAERLGEFGNDLFECEFQVHGARVYNESLILPIRNAWYSHRTLPTRHAMFYGQYPLKTPILDYGCGIGFTLMWLHDMGYAASDLWGWDVPGVQATVTQKMFEEAGINWGIPDNPGTVLCFHVLEHLENPFEDLAKLRALGGKLYATCVSDLGHGHVVDDDKAQEIILDLQKHGEYAPDYFIHGDSNV